MKWIKSIVVVVLYVTQISMIPADTGNIEKSGIEFHADSWENALALAKKENKLVFLGISASWCGYCKKLESKTFPNEKVGKFYNANFVNISLDGEKGQGAKLARKYSVKGYPTLLFVDSNEKVVKKAVGYHDVERFLKLGQSVHQKYQ